MAECPVDVHFLYLPWDLERFELWIWLILFLAHSHSSISTDRKKGYSLVCFSKKERKVVEYTGGLHTIHYSIPSVPHHISSWLVTDFSPFTTTVVTSFFFIYIFAYHYTNYRALVAELVWEIEVQFGRGALFLLTALVIFCCYPHRLMEMVLDWWSVCHGECFKTAGCMLGQTLWGW